MSLYESARNAPLEQVIELCFPNTTFKKLGNKTVICCPLHGEKKSSLTLFPNNSWYCFGCGKGGSGIDFVIETFEVTHFIAANFIKKYVDSEPVGPVNTTQPAVASLMANVKYRDKVYQAFLKSLPLLSEHKQDLKRRGLTDNYIRRNQYKSVPWDMSIRRPLIRKLPNPEGVPGFFLKEGSWDCIAPEGYFIPVRTKEGLIQALKIKATTGDAKYIWFSSADRERGCSSGCPEHYPLGYQDIGNVWLTEGPLKADIASSILKTPFAGVGGINAWQGFAENLAKETTVLIAYDKENNKNVIKAIKDIKNALVDRGHFPKEVKWNKDCGKGIDDALTSMSSTSTIEMLVDGVPVKIKRSVEVQIG